jgi:hypothetical protein
MLAYIMTSYYFCDAAAQWAWYAEVKGFQFASTNIQTQQNKSSLRRCWH